MTESVERPLCRTLPPYNTAEAMPIQLADVLPLSPAANSHRSPANAHMHGYSLAPCWAKRHAAADALAYMA